MDLFDNGQSADTWNHFLKSSPQHMHAEMLNALLKISSFDLVFMIVRNPIERIKSEFKWRKKYNMIDQKISYENWLTKTLRRYYKNNYIYGNHIRPQHEFELPEAKIFKMENGLEKIPIWIEKELNISFSNSEMTTSMKSQGNIPNKLSFKLNDITKNELSKFYSVDMQRYNYNDS